MKKSIPNIITLANLFFGCLATVSIVQGDVMQAVQWILLAALADFLDGYVARLLQVQSPLGAELDSLADAISFGLVPGAICFHLLGGTSGETSIWKASPGFLLSLFAILRLGKFNLDTRQRDEFIGLPTPASTVFVMGWLLMVHYNSFGIAGILQEPAIIYALIALLSFLMNAELPMFSLKFKNLRWADNKYPFILLGTALPALLLWQEAALSMIIAWYIILSLIRHLIAQKQAQ
jgi:CDP-diacylglycerol--serine O-phosphatidyltransferase